jgi:hypothetical protein
MIRFLQGFEQGGVFMSYLRIAAPALLILLIFAGAADAQRKTSKKSPAKKTAPAKAAVLPPLNVRAAREKVEIQLENVKRFIDVLGPIAQDLESADLETGSGSRLQAVSEKNEANKQKVISAIRNLRDGLSTLESEFRTKPELQRYLSKIQGITDLAARSEDSAIAGRFVASKDPLRTVSQKLTDTLRTLPAAPPI